MVLLISARSLPVINKSLTYARIMVIDVFDFLMKREWSLLHCVNCMCFSVVESFWYQTLDACLSPYSDLLSLHTGFWICVRCVPNLVVWTYRFLRSGRREEKRFGRPFDVDTILS